MRKAIACILLFVLPSFALPYSTTGLVEQQSETAMGQITNRALNFRLRTGDAFEAATRLEIQAARLREQKLEFTIQNAALRRTLTPTEEEVTAAQNRFALNGVVMERWEVRQLLSANRKAAIAHINQVGVYRVLMEAARFARIAAVQDSSQFSLVNYSPAARLLQVMSRDNCDGAQLAIDSLTLIGSVALLIPGAEAAGGITLLFGAILQFTIRSSC